MPPPPRRPRDDRAFPAGRRRAASRPSRSTGPSARTRSRSSATPSCATRSARSRDADDVQAVVIDRRRRQLLLGRRRARDHRPARSAVDMPELLAFTRMTGDLVKAMRACPQPIVAAVDGVCAGAGAILAMASRHPPRDAGGADRVPVHPRRPRRLRHGRLRDPAAHHRPGPRRRAALHRPLDDAPRRASAGASSTGSSRRTRSQAEAHALARRARRRADLRARA